MGADELGDPVGVLVMAFFSLGAWIPHVSPVFCESDACGSEGVDRCVTQNVECAKKNFMSIDERIHRAL